MFRTTSSALSGVPQRTIRKVLVANRGEIACRVFRTCKAMGIQTVAVYCDAERSGKHVQHADEAVRIGAPPAATSYLRGDVIVEAARRHGVDAIHPGYGFLSENAEFAAAVAAAGIEFVGPPASAITAMGSKSESKVIMTAAGVPVVPGYHGERQDDDFLLQQARDAVRFPLLIKAVSGGGGKGMKIVRSEADFLPQLHSARREALNFFKDERVLLERYIEAPRHVEVQVFCDKHGGAVFFFERDCSVQRRHQKVLEEAPAPGLSDEQRQRIGAVAVQAARAVGYVGAGTVEFIVDTATGEFFFMEMNTRLQVEHPVTEEVCRVRGGPLDLVRLQLDVAAGKPLGFTQADLALAGHCIEARVFAESPRNNFLPGSGHLAFVQEPAEGADRFGGCKVRVDTGFRGGDDVLVHYDPMIAKLIVWGPDRAAALRGLRAALDEYHIVGIPTNVAFLKRCCDHPAFAAGGVTTKFIDEHKAELLRGDAVAPHVAALIAVETLRADAAAAANSSAAASSMGFRVNGKAATRLAFRDADDKPLVLRVTEAAPGVFEVEQEGAPTARHVVRPCAALAAGNAAAHVAAADGTEQRVEYRAVPLRGQTAVLLAGGGGTHVLRRAPPPTGFGDVRYEAGGASRVLSPMPGKMARRLVADGTRVEQGQRVLIVEAMKMEHVVTAPCAGVVRFAAREGDMAAADQVLATIDTEEEASS